MKKTLTITIPSYNAEKYLATCLDSLCVPGIIEDLDVIIVNDGSTDGTEKIASEYVLRYPESVRLINKENGGHGSGINCGIRESFGEYFKVIDADDWAAEAGLKELLLYLKDCTDKGKQPDLVSTKFLWAFDNGSGDIRSFRTKAQFEKPFSDVEYGTIYNLDSVVRELYIKFHNLTVRTGLLRENHIVMDEHVYYEDAEYALYPVLCAKDIAFTEGPLYMYRIGNAGQSMSRDKMVLNAKNYDTVLDSLFYVYQKGGFSSPVQQYTESFIARFFTGRVKISLLMPVGKTTRKEIIEMNQNLQEKYPAIYRANGNKAVDCLRKSGYLLYWPAALAVRLRGVI